jgi:hypothetical protein
MHSAGFLRSHLTSAEGNRGKRLLWLLLRHLGVLPKEGKVAWLGLVEMS